MTRRTASTSAAAGLEASQSSCDVDDSGIHSDTASIGPVLIPTMVERCQKGDLLFPLVNFLVHSVDNITAMEFKRYDSGNYQRARARSPLGLPDPPLEDVVSGIVRFMTRHGIIKGRKAQLVLERL